MHEYRLNLGLAMDLALHAASGSVEPHAPYLTVRTPDAPDYFFGNLLVLPARPAAADLPQLEHDFARLIGVPPRIAHRTFTWPENGDGEVDLAAFAAHGYETTVCRVLAAHPREVRASAVDASLEIRPFAAERDWDDWLQLQQADMATPDEPSTQRFLAYQQAAHRQLIARGLGDWWGAFTDGELVGCLGLFFLYGIGCFQSIVTAEAHRNRNVCKTLLAAVAERTAGRAERLVVVADEAYHAGAIYEKMGFRPQGRMASLCRTPAPPTPPVPPR